METSKNYDFYLPSRDSDDVADINLISENFKFIDAKVGSMEEDQLRLSQDVESNGYDIKDIELKLKEKIDTTKANQIFASSIRNTASGNIVSLTDISPIEHTLEVKARSKNLLPPITQESLNASAVNGVVTQKVADTATNITCVLQGYLNDVYIEPLLHISTLTNIGIVKITFTKTEAYNQLVFGISGSTIDTKVTIDASILENGQTYTIQANFTNITQGSISWCDMQIEKGTTATEYTPFVDVSTANGKVSGKNWYDNSMNETDRDTTATGYTKFKIDLPNGTYTWSLKENKFFGSGIYVLITDDKNFNGTTPESGHFISWVGHTVAESLNVLSRTFTVTKGYIYLAAGLPSTSYLITLFEYLKEFQIEFGTVPTEYESFREPISYAINSDGTVEGVTSLYPTTTLIPDTEGVVLDVEYNADTKKYIDNKIEAKFAELAAMIVNS